MFFFCYCNERYYKFKIILLFHDEELDEEELNKCFAKLDPKTIELIQQEYHDD